VHLSDGAAYGPHSSYIQFIQVFDRIRIFVEDESDKLTGEYGHAEADDSALLARAVREFDDVTADPDPDSSSSAGDGDTVGSPDIVAGHEDSLSPPSDNLIAAPTNGTITKDFLIPALDDVMQESSHHPSEADLESWIILQVSHTIMFKAF
jgi:hypothetical protein